MDGVREGQAPGERGPIHYGPISASLSPPCSECREPQAGNKSLSGPQESREGKKAKHEKCLIPGSGNKAALQEGVSRVWGGARGRSRRSQAGVPERKRGDTQFGVSQDPAWQ